MAEKFYYSTQNVIHHKNARLILAIDQGTAYQALINSYKHKNAQSDRWLIGSAIAKDSRVVYPKQITYQKAHHHLLRSCLQLYLHFTDDATKNINIKYPLEESQKAYQYLWYQVSKHYIKLIVPTDKLLNDNEYKKYVKNIIHGTNGLPIASAISEDRQHQDLTEKYNTIHMFNDKTTKNIHIVNPHGKYYSAKSTSHKPKAKRHQKSAQIITDKLPDDYLKEAGNVDKPDTSNSGLNPIHYSKSQLDQSLENLRRSSKLADYRQLIGNHVNRKTRELFVSTADAERIKMVNSTFVDKLIQLVCGSKSHSSKHYQLYKKAYQEEQNNDKHQLKGIRPFVSVMHLYQTYSPKAETLARQLKNNLGPNWKQKLMHNPKQKHIMLEDAGNAIMAYYPPALVREPMSGNDSGNAVKGNADDQYVVIFDPLTGTWTNKSGILWGLAESLKHYVTNGQFKQLLDMMAARARNNNNLITPYNGSRYLLFRNGVLDVTDMTLHKLTEPFVQNAHFLTRCQLNINCPIERHMVTKKYHGKHFRMSEPITVTDDEGKPAIKVPNLIKSPVIPHMKSYHDGDWRPLDFIRAYGNNDPERISFFLVLIGLGFFSGHNSGVNVDIQGGSGWGKTSLAYMYKGIFSGRIFNTNFSALNGSFPFTGYSKDNSLIWIDECNRNNDELDNANGTPLYDNFCNSHANLKVKNKNDLSLENPPQMYVEGTGVIHSETVTAGPYRRTIVYKLPNLTKALRHQAYANNIESALMNRHVDQWLVLSSMCAIRNMIARNYFDRGLMMHKQITFASYNLKHRIKYNSPKNIKRIIRRHNKAINNRIIDVDSDSKKKYGLAKINAHNQALDNSEHHFEKFYQNNVNKDTHKDIQVAKQALRYINKTLWNKYTHISSDNDRAEKFSNDKLNSIIHSMPDKKYARYIKIDIKDLKHIEQFIRVVVGTKDNPGRGLVYIKPVKYKNHVTKDKIVNNLKNANIKDPGNYDKLVSQIRRIFINHLSNFTLNLNDNEDLSLLPQQAQEWRQEIAGDNNGLSRWFLDYIEPYLSKASRIGNVDINDPKQLKKLTILHPLFMFRLYSYGFYEEIHPGDHFYNRMPYEEFQKKISSVFDQYHYSTKPAGHAEKGRARARRQISYMQDINFDFRHYQQDYKGEYPRDYVASGDDSLGTPFRKKESDWFYIYKNNGSV